MYNFFYQITLRSTQIFKNKIISINSLLDFGLSHRGLNFIRPRDGTSGISEKKNTSGQQNRFHFSSSKYRTVKTGYQFFKDFPMSCLQQQVTIILIYPKTLPSYIIRTIALFLAFITLSLAANRWVLKKLLAVAKNISCMLSKLISRDV